MSTLYIVATPIGNLEDISMRALRILGEVDFVLCEDTRTTGKLLSHYEIKTPTISYHQHSDSRKNEQILNMLGEGKNLALVSDAGTPGISDPGGKLVAAVVERFGEDVKIESVPGPSAVTAALSISGVPTDRFVFMGFPPHKKGRQTFIRKVIESDLPAVVYESKHRILKLLEEIQMASKGAGFGENDEEVEKITNYELRIKNKGKKSERKNKKLTSVVVCREISKMHETVYRGDIDLIIDKIKESANDQKGEFVVIVGK